MSLLTSGMKHPGIHCWSIEWYKVIINNIYGPKHFFFFSEFEDLL